jgi:hypothetical protein
MIWSAAIPFSAPSLQCVRIPNATTNIVYDWPPAGKLLRRRAGARHSKCRRLPAPMDVSMHNRDITAARLTNGTLAYDWI